MLVEQATEDAQADIPDAIAGNLVDKRDLIVMPNPLEEQIDARYAPLCLLSHANCSSGISTHPFQHGGGGWVGGDTSGRKRSR